MVKRLIATILLIVYGAMAMAAGAPSTRDAIDRTDSDRPQWQELGLKDLVVPSGESTTASAPAPMRLLSGSSQPVAQVYADMPRTGALHTSVPLPHRTIDHYLYTTGQLRL